MNQQQSRALILGALAIAAVGVTLAGTLPIPRQAAPPVTPATAQAAERTKEGYLVIGRLGTYGRQLQCPRCAGGGKVDFVQFTGEGASPEVHAWIACPVCGGKGWIVEAELYPQIH